jgi:DNA-binding transcriptional ArsR family regulator
MAENVLVLEPGDERAQKIAKAMASPQAGEILQLMAEGPKSLSDISEKLKIPMNTAKYHLENLLEAGVIAVADTKYSIKGREVKLYSLTDQLLIVAPRRADVRSMLLKYASLFGIIGVSTLALSSILPALSGTGMHNEMVALQAPAPAVDTANGAGREAGAVALKATFDSSAGPAAAAPIDPVLTFFLGGILVIFVLICYEAWLWKTKR